MSDLMTPADLAAKYPWASRSTLYSAMKDGLLPYYRLPSGLGKKGKYLIKESEFVGWVESNRVGRHPLLTD